MKSSNDEEKCKLVDGTFGYIVQFILFVIVISSLYYKRYKEKPQRPMKIWMLDVGKQICSGTEAHLINMGVSIYILSEDDLDECEWYFVNFTMDTTIGVGLTFFFLKSVEWGARQFDWNALKVSGEYGTPTNYSTYFKQLAVWLFIICLVKTCVVMFIFLLSAPLVEFGKFVLGWLTPSPDVELLVVMIACPCFMNLFQYWVQDSFIKKKASSESDYGPLGGEEESFKPLREVVESHSSA